MVLANRQDWHFKANSSLPVRTICEIMFIDKKPVNDLM